MGLFRGTRMAGWLVGLVGSALVLGGCGLLDLLPPLPPDRAPEEVRASAGEVDDSIQITWQPVERATSYEVFRADREEGPFMRFGTTSATETRDPVAPGRLFWYKVRACNAAGCGPESSPVFGYAGYPPPPTNVRATRDRPDRIAISWDPVPGATYYQVFRDRVQDGTYAHVVTASVNSPPVEDTQASVGLRYWYKVKACRVLPEKTVCSSLSEAAFGCRAPCPPGGFLDAEE